MFDPGPKGTGNGKAEFLSAVLSSSHIFASAINQILENDLLRRVSPIHVSLAQVHILKLIERDGEHLVSDIAKFLGVSAPAASRSLDRLVRMGLLRRAVPSVDRRTAPLRITLEGRKLLKEYDQVRAECLLPVLDKFTDEELGQFSGLVNRFARFLIEEGGHSGDQCLRCGGIADAKCPILNTIENCPYEQARRTLRRSRKISSNHD
jgi:DNA-binding MarR family transcriptional regulator